MPSRVAPTRSRAMRSRFFAGAGSVPNRSMVSHCRSSSSASDSTPEMRLYITRRACTSGRKASGSRAGNVQIDLRAVVQRPLELRLPTRTQRGHRALEQLEVQREADLVDLAALLLAEQLARAADLEVVRREHEAGAQVLERLDRLEPLGGVAGQRVRAAGRSGTRRPGGANARHGPAAGAAARGRTGRRDR